MQVSGGRCGGISAASWGRRLLATALLSVPLLASALGLGELQVTSRLNQPLEARIPLISATAGQLEQLKVSLADTQTLERAGIVPTRLLLGLRFDVVRGAGGDHVRVRSTGSVREPVFEFVLDVAWPGGQMLREYSVLLTAP